MSEDVQARVDAAIRALGGYWSPLAGLARVLEELAELAAAETITERSREAADCAVAALAIANQYCVPISGVPHSLALTGERHALICAGQLARLVNRCEGAKPPKPTEAGMPSFAATVAELFSGLAAAVEMPVGQLLDMAAATAEANAIRDTRRFVPRSDCVTSALRDEFARDVMALHVINPTTGLWGARAAVHEGWQPDVERFLRVDAINPLSAFIVRSFRDADDIAKDLRAVNAIPGLEGRARLMSGAGASYLVVEGRRGLS